VVDYSNPRIPEGINTSREHPLKEFATLTVGIVGAVVAVAVILGLLADRLAQHIPFAYEQGLAVAHADSLPAGDKIAARLQALADRIARVMDLPEEMHVTVHYSDAEAVNAYATLGGHVVLYRGLLEKLPHENALAMVLAHEMAHIRHRHPIRALGRGAVVGLAIGALTGLSGNDLVGEVMGDAGLLTVLKFSRDQERQADRTGMSAVAELYGHVSGTLDLYRVLLEHAGKAPHDLPAFMSTHPLAIDRIEDLEALSRENGWRQDGLTLPLGDKLRDLQPLAAPDQARAAHCD
jgi:Zn-dependent protease with chaperone function